MKRVKILKSRAFNSISDKTNFFINFMFLIYMFICVIPFIVVISTSITEETTLLAKGYSIIPNKLSFYAYTFIFKGPGILMNAYGITLFVTVIGTVLGVLFTCLYAYPLSRTDFPFKKFFSIFLFATMIINGGIVPFYLLYTQLLHLSNTVWALILPYCVNPFFIIITKTFFRMTIPDSVIESALIDGIGELRMLFKIILPLSLPVIGTIALFCTLMYWNDWWLSLMFITNSKIISLQYLLYKMISNLQFAVANIGTHKSSILPPRESLRMAMLILSIGPVVLAYPFLQKYFVKGLVIGAVKG